MDLNPLINAIATRAFLLALGFGLYTTLSFHRNGHPWDPSLTEGAMAFLLAMGVRGVLEGGYDVTRALGNKVRPGDVPRVAAAIQRRKDV